MDRNSSYDMNYKFYNRFIARIDYSTVILYHTEVRTVRYLGMKVPTLAPYLLVRIRNQRCVR